MAHTDSHPFPCLDQRLPLQERLGLIQARLQQIEPRLERLAFAL